MMKFIKLTSIAMITAVTMSANAGILITDWGYVNEAGVSEYSNDTLNTTVSGNSLPGMVGTYDSLAWGSQRRVDDSLEGLFGFNNDNELHPQSSLVVTTPIISDGGLLPHAETNGDWYMGTAITHNNWVIGGNPFDSATLLDALQLTPLSPDLGFSLPAPSLEFEILFTETPNQANFDRSGDTYTDYSLKDVQCPDGGQNGVGVNINGCGDIFVFKSDSTDFFFEDGVLMFSSTFNLGLPEFDAYDYTVTTRLTGLSALSDEGCASVGEGSGCFGFVTQENSINVLTPEFRITSTRVPEPSTLAILGLGLFGLVARKKIKA